MAYLVHFDRIRHHLSLKSLHAHPIPIPLTFPDLYEFPRCTKSDVAQRYFFQAIRFRKDPMRRRDFSQDLEAADFPGGIHGGG